MRALASNYFKYKMLGELPVGLDVGLTPFKGRWKCRVEFQTLELQTLELQALELQALELQALELHVLAHQVTSTIFRGEIFRRRINGRNCRPTGRSFSIPNISTPRSS